VIVYTCVFGHTDPLHEPVVTGSARFVCFTDQPIKSRRWEIVRVDPQNAPTRASRMMKARSHAAFPDAEWTLWMDANFSMEVDPESLKPHGEFVRFIHRDRARITDEAQEIVRLGKAKPDAIARQLAEYRAAGFDTDANPMHELSCNGVILRRHTPEVVALNEAWAAEISRHTLRDQMSLDYCAWRQGYTLAAWPGNHKVNPYFRITTYKRPTNDF
jgi:hypothetical protein